MTYTLPSIFGLPKPHWNIYDDIHMSSLVLCIYSFCACCVIFLNIGFRRRKLSIFKYIILKVKNRELNAQVNNSSLSWNNLLITYTFKINDIFLFLRELWHLKSLANKIIKFKRRPANRNSPLIFSFNFKTETCL